MSDDEVRAFLSEQRTVTCATLGPRGWPRTGEVPASRRARLWISPERARWAREERTVMEELEDGSVVVELSFAGVAWLVREVLKEAGDAAVLEPPEAREAVRRAVARLQVAARA